MKKYNYSMKAWWKKTAELLLKFVLIGAAIFFILKRLSTSEYHGIFTYTWHDAPLNISLFLLMGLLNLWLDAAIWKRVNRFVEDISLRRAFKTNFICYALAFITPANSGELAGRYIMINQKGDRSKTLFLTFWSHFPRFVTKFLLGGSALILLSWMAAYLSTGLMVSLIGIGLLVLLAFYLNFIKIQKVISRWKKGRIDLSQYIIHHRPYTSEKIQLLILAILKYLSYNLQFLLLLAMWTPETLGWEMILSVIVFYFITALIPTFAAADFLIKGALALYIFNGSLATESQLINASLIIWIFNIALPALGGSLIIFRTNLIHSLKSKFARGSRYVRED